MIIATIHPQGVSSLDVDVVDDVGRVVDRELVDEDGLYVDLDDELVDGLEEDLYEDDGLGV